MNYNFNINDEIPTHTYVDINCYNRPSNTDEDTPKFLEYTELHQTYILPNPSNQYYMSIVRFSLETGSLPIWIPTPVIGEVNMLVYKIYLSYTLSTGETLTEFRNVEWMREDLTARSENPDYYYAYSSTHIINVFNQTFNFLFQRMQSLVSSRSETFSWKKGAFFSLDTNNRWILNVDFNLFDTNPRNENPAIGRCQLSIDNGLYNLISSFSCLKISPTLYRFNIYNNNNSNILILQETVGVPSTIYMLQLVQEYDSSSLFCPIKSIVFKTNLIPISYSLTTVPLVLNATNQFQNTQNSIENMLTDMEVDMTDISANNSIIQYSPSGEYRLVDLVGSNKINQIDVQCFWRDQEGSLNKLYLESGRSFNMKLLFRMKNFNKK